MGRRITAAIDAILVVAAVTTAAMVVWSMLSRPSSGERRVGDWEGQPGYDSWVGDSEARYRLVVWTDYQCPACKRLDSELVRLRVQYGEDIAFAIRHFPMQTVHPLAESAARAAECGRRFGAFESMHAALFAADLNGPELVLEQLSSAVPGLQPEELRACIDSPETEAAIAEDHEAAVALELRGTPTLQIGRALITGGMPAEEIMKRLKD